MRLHHAQAKLVGVVAFRMSASLRDASAESPHRTLRGHQLDTFLKRHIHEYSGLNSVLSLRASMTASASSSAPSPPCSQCVDRATRGRFAQLTDFWRFPHLGVGHKSVDAHHGRHAGTLHRIDVVQQVAAACLHEAFSVRYSSGRGRPGTNTLSRRADGRHRRRPGQAAVVAFEVQNFS